MESTSVLSAFSTRSNCAVRMSSMLAVRDVAVRPDQPRSANATSLHVTATQRSRAAREEKCRRDRTGLLHVQRREQAPKAGSGRSAGSATRRERSQQPRSASFAPGLPRSDQSLPQQCRAGPDVCLSSARGYVPRAPPQPRRLAGRTPLAGLSCSLVTAGDSMH
jgi:hypothetical protein